MYNKLKALLFRFFNSRRYFLAGTMLISFLLHLPFFNEPPRSIHVWRQCNTLAVARNFYQEDMNILKPRVDRRFDSDGVTGMQFPSYEYGLAILYKIFGEHNVLHRLYSFLIFCAGLLAFYELLFLITASRFLAAAGTWALCWSPEIYYHSINALPDVLALSASIAGLLFFLRWDRHGSVLNFFLALLFIILGGLTKLQYLVVGFPIAAVVLNKLLQKKYSVRHMFMLAVFALLSILIPLSWYKYAVDLIETSNLRDFGIGIRSMPDLNASLKILQMNLFSHFPELLLNYSNTILLLCGCFAFFKMRKWHHPWFLPLLIWFLALLAWHIIEIRQLDVHHYYMMPYIPFMMLIAVYGVSFLRQRKYEWAVLLLLIIQPVLAVARIVPPRWTEGKEMLPPELYSEKIRDELSSATPKNELVVAGPDISGCIYFYFLDKQGFGFDNTAQLSSVKGETILLDDYISRGAKYLYSSDTTLLSNENLKPYLGKVLKKEGNFVMIELISGHN